MILNIYDKHQLKTGKGRVLWFIRWWRYRFQFLSARSN